MSPRETDNLKSIALEAAAAQPDVPAQLARAIREAAAGPADPWVVIGVLIAGAAHTIGIGLPPERRMDCVAAACQLLARL